jgi:HEAT repeat protein
MAEFIEFSPQEIERNLLDGSEPFALQFLQSFSDITQEDLAKVKKVWPRVSQQRKVKLIQELENLMQIDTLISCDDFGLFALDDDDPIIKSEAISLLWECVDLNLASRFINILQEDKDPDLSAAAAAGLGKFVLLGELEEIPQKQAKKVLDTLIQKYLSSQNSLLQQSILESLGYASNEQIASFIIEALNQPEKEWIISALFAISRSANEDWAKVVLDKLNDLDPDIQLEAIKAAGELEITDAKDTIIEILELSLPEDEIHLQAIWSLSMIGGADVRNLFEKMLEFSDSEKEIAMIEMALENLELTNSFGELDFFDED